MIIPGEVADALPRYRMFEPNMDEYLDEEIDFVKACFEQTCRAWETQVRMFVAYPLVWSHLTALAPPTVRPHHTRSA